MTLFFLGVDPDVIDSLENNPWVWVAYLALPYLYWRWAVKLDAEEKKLEEFEVEEEGEEVVENTLLNELIAQCKDHNIDFENFNCDIFPSIAIFTKTSPSFFKHSDLLEWKKNTKATYRDIIDLLTSTEQREREIAKFLNYYNNGEELRKKSNHYYIQREKLNYAKYFNNEFKNPLTEEQKEAVLAKDDFNLINAGAGCGKTSTLIAKIKFLVDIYGYSGKDILLLVFNKAVAEELSEKTKKYGCEVRTFHAFGNSCSETKNVFTKEKNRIGELMERRLEDDQYYNKFITYFNYYFKKHKERQDFKNNKDYRDYCKNTRDIITLKGNEKSVDKKHKGERVKSIEELVIANFLFTNNIKYIYEKKLNVPEDAPGYDDEKPTYTPDFYLPDYNIWIEHYGLNKKLKCKIDRYTASKQKKYEEDFKWKRSFHKWKKTKYVETFSYESKKEGLAKALEKKLKKCDPTIIFNPMSKDEVLKIIKTNDGYSRKMQELFSSFLTFIKSDNINIKNLHKKQEKNIRNQKFLELFEPVYNDYQESLEINEEIDFSDMIGKAIESEKIKEKKYSIIMVDEFQDIGANRYRLVKKLAEINPRSEITCVGDDWQSINAFAGSKIDYIWDFNKYFNTVAYNITLSQTFRFSNQMCQLTNQFIQQNEWQIKKAIHSIKTKEDFIEIKNYEWKKECNTCDTIKNIIFDINTEKKEKSILLLNRYRLGPQQRYESNGVLNLLRQQKNKNTTFKTIHSSKGLEADFVIIDGLNSNFFPSNREDDEVMKMVKSSKEEVLYAEERRLFYVALTRAKEKVYLLYEKGEKSPFITEIEKIMESTVF